MYEAVAAGGKAALVMYVLDPLLPCLSPPLDQKAQG